MIDQNTNIKTKKNVVFSVEWFLKSRLNDTFLFTSKKLQMLILVTMMYKQTLSEKKSRKVKKKIMCAFNKQRQNCVVRYHLLTYISAYQSQLTKLMNEISNLINID